MPSLLYTVLFTAVLVGPLSGWLGHRLAAGQCAEAQVVVQRKAVEDRDTYLVALRHNLESEQRRAVAAAEKRARRRATAEGVSANVANLPARCEFIDAERVQFHALYRAYGYATEADSAGVRDPVPGAAPAESPTPAVGSPGSDLGRGLRRTTR